MYAVLLFTPVKLSVYASTFIFSILIFNLSTVSCIIFERIPTSSCELQFIGTSKFPLETSCAALVKSDKGFVIP